MRAPGRRDSSVKRRPSSNSTTRKRRRRPVRKAIFAVAPRARGVELRALEFGVPLRPRLGVRVGSAPDLQRRHVGIQSAPRLPSAHAMTIVFTEWRNGD